MASLEEHLDEVLPNEEARENWQIDDEAAAAWALRKLAHIKAARMADQRLADAEIERIEGWLAARDKIYANDEAFFTSHLRAYHARRFAEDPRAKTIKLPHGTLTCRKQQPEYSRDEKALLKWVKANRPEYVKVVESTNWAALKKHLVLVSVDDRLSDCVDKSTGEIVEGVVAINRPVRYDVEVVGDGR